MPCCRQITKHHADVLPQLLQCTNCGYSWYKNGMFEIEQPYFNDSTDDRITTQSTNLYMAINKDYEKQHTQQLYHSCLQ